MVLEGIDVSSWQGVIDWSKVRGAGKAFAFIKATESIDFRDEHFPHNWAGAHARGLVRGAYCYFHPNIDAVGQAQYFLDYVHAYGGFVTGDFIALDVEQDAGLGASEVVRGAERWLSYIKAHSQPNVCLYTYPFFWMDQLGNPVSEALAACPLWLADYGPGVPTLRNWPGGLAFWQYSQNASCAGIDGDVDLDRFYGSRAQLKRLAQKPKGV